MAFLWAICKAAITPCRGIVRSVPISDRTSQDYCVSNARDTELLALVAGRSVSATVAPSAAKTRPARPHPQPSSSTRTPFTTQPFMDSAARESLDVLESSLTNALPCSTAEDALGERGKHLPAARLAVMFLLSVAHECE